MDETSLFKNITNTQTYAKGWNQNQCKRKDLRSWNIKTVGDRSKLFKFQCLKVSLKNELREDSIKIDW